MKLWRSFLANGVAILFQKIIRIADQLLLVPFFLTYWGAAYYGEWLTLSIIPSILAFSDLGLGSAVSNSFVLAYAAGDKQKAANLKKSGLVIVTLSVILGMLITAAVVIGCHKMHVFDHSHINSKDAILAVLFIMISKLSSFYIQMIEGFFRGARKAALGSFLGSGSYLLNILVGFCILLQGGGVVEYAFSQLVISFLYTIIYASIGYQMITLKGFNGVILKSDLLDISKKGMGYLMTPIWQSIFFQGTTFVVRLTLGAETVAVFNTVRTVCRSVNQFFSIINGSIFPALQYEYGRGNIEVVRKHFSIAVLVSMIVGVMGTIALVLFGLNIYEWWTKSILVVPMEVWNIFMLGVLLNGIWWTSTVTYRMTNQPYHFAVVSTVTATLSVSITYFLSINYGLVGAAIGCTLFELIMAFYVLSDSCKLLGMNVRDLLIYIKQIRFVGGRL